MADDIMKADIEEVQRIFSNLPKVFQSKTLRSAGRAGAKVLMQAAAVNIESVTSGQSTGIGKKSLAVYKLRNFQGNLRYAVMVKKGKINPAKKDGSGSPVRVGLYLSVLEYGKEGQPPRSWIRKAAREKPNEALNAVTETIRSKLDEAINEAKK